MGPSFGRLSKTQFSEVYEMQYVHFSFNTAPNNVVMREYRHIFVSTDLINIA